ncbi:MAG: TRAP transporter substrate-binding protein DctP, partial [Thiohalomonadales bacterium]
MKKLPLFVALWFLISFQSVQARTLKIATIAPEGTSWMKEIRKGAKKISKLTHNHVKFKFYTGGVMGNEKNVLKKMRVGQLQGGVFTSSVLANIYPDAQIYNLPFLFKS